MAAWRYEISLLVLKMRSLVKYFLTLEEKFRISARPCNILYLWNCSTIFFPVELPSFGKDRIREKERRDQQLKVTKKKAHLKVRPKDEIIGNAGTSYQKGSKDKKYPLLRKVTPADLRREWNVVKKNECSSFPTPV